MRSLYKLGAASTKSSPTCIFPSIAYQHSLCRGYRFILPTRIHNNNKVLLKSSSLSPFSTNTAHSNRQDQNWHFVPIMKSYTGITTKIPHPSRLDPVLAPYIRTCLTDDNEIREDYDYSNDFRNTSQNSTEKKKNTKGFLDTGLSLAFLGTGSNSPSRHRNTSSLIVNSGGNLIMVDCGEGTQRQLSFSLNGGTFSRSLQKIMVTHLHYDHIGGLVGLLLYIHTSHSLWLQSKKATDPNWKGLQDIDIYGPPGLYRFLGTSLALSQAKLCTNVTVHELHPLPPSGQKQQKQPNYIRNLNHKIIYPTSLNDSEKENQDGSGGLYWSISDIKPPQRQRQDSNKNDFSSNGDKEDSQHIRRNLRDSTQNQINISAVSIKHTNTMPCFSFIIEEERPAAPISSEKALASGVLPGIKYDELKLGFTVMSDFDPKLGIPELELKPKRGGRRRDRIEKAKEEQQKMEECLDNPNFTPVEVHPEQVLLYEEQKKSRKIVCLGDNCGIFGKALLKLGQDCDVLVNEATINGNDTREAKRRGHSTPFMSGTVAKTLGAKVLLLNHISNANENGNDLVRVVQSAKKAANQDTQNGREVKVLPSFDFMEFLIPRGGFTFNENEK